MMRDAFPTGVAEQLKWYVYRLIDPRNGETFYVGKGEGNSIFQHATSDSLETEDEDDLDLTAQRVKAIQAAGLEVGHLVHRHGIDTQEIAYEIEAALIDAYPGLTNQAAGHGPGDYGCRHVEQINRDYAAVEQINRGYAAEEFEVLEPLILIYVSRSLAEGRSVYDAVSYAWRVNIANVNQRNLVLAHDKGMVVGAFRPDNWMKATTENFPTRHTVPGRYGFVGREAERPVWDHYVGKRVPARYRQKGAAAQPIRYCHP